MLRLVRVEILAILWIKVLPGVPGRRLYVVGPSDGGVSVHPPPYFSTDVLK
jgi:hypothetical protein